MNKRRRFKAKRLRRIARLTQTATRLRLLWRGVIDLAPRAPWIGPSEMFMLQPDGIYRSVEDADPIKWERISFTMTPDPHP